MIAYSGDLVRSPGEADITKRGIVLRTCGKTNSGFDNSKQEPPVHQPKPGPVPGKYDAPNQ
ncbi:hypothetical protein DUT91_02220 [Phyllobacterium salinisoli]|uniref:Uncharacterized protein n=1 Tax=Phyllobacterium salinisoli TaxID=1899321 RepID=A0A368KC17_9HYPH|nr:hypothetical protein DUT91_02220 [Phyllobacterium salinisoli]